MKDHKILLGSTITAFLLLIVLISYVLYLLYCPVRTLVVKNAPMPIVGSRILKAGDFVTYRYDYCKYYEHPLSIQRDFVDGVVYQTDESRAQLEPGCHVRDVKVPIPETLPAGHYKIRNITQVAVNQLRVVTVQYETEYFDVIK